MKERRFANGTGRRGLTCIALLFFILAGSGIACASPGEGVQVNSTNGEILSVDAEDVRQSALGEPPNTTAYQGSGNVFSFFYDLVIFACALGAAIMLLVGYILIRRGRGKDAP